MFDLVVLILVEETEIAVCRGQDSSHLQCTIPKRKGGRERERANGSPESSAE